MWYFNPFWHPFSEMEKGCGSCGAPSANFSQLCKILGLPAIFFYRFFPFVCEILAFFLVYANFGDFLHTLCVQNLCAHLVCSKLCLCYFVSRFHLCSQVDFNQKAPTVLNIFAFEYFFVQLSQIWSFNFNAIKCLNFWGNCHLKRYFTNSTCQHVRSNLFYDYWYGTNLPPHI